MVISAFPGPEVRTRGAGDDANTNLALVTEYLPIALSDLRKAGPMVELQARPLIRGVRALAA